MMPNEKDLGKERSQKWEPYDLSETIHSNFYDFHVVKIHSNLMAILSSSEWYCGEGTSKQSWPLGWIRGVNLL